MKKLEIGKFKFLDKKENELKRRVVNVKIDYLGWFRRLLFKSIELLIVILMGMVLVATFYYFYFKGY